MGLLLACARRKPRDYLLLRLLYAAGLRRQEVATLLVADMIWEACCILIRASKRDKDRYILVDRVTAEESTGPQLPPHHLGILWRSRGHVARPL